MGQLDGRAFAASESVLLFALMTVGGAYHWIGALIAGLLLRAVPSLLIDLGVNRNARRRSRCRAPSSRPR